MGEPYFLKSNRIGFRPWTLDDMDLAIELWGDPEVSKYLGGPFTMSAVPGKLMTERSILRLHNYQYWPIFLLETGEFIGCCGLRPYTPSEKVYEFGVHIKSAYWRKGYATEAAKAVIDYAFKKLDAKSLFAGHHPENMISKHLLEKLGFSYTHDEYYEPTKLQHPSYLLSKQH